MQETCNNTHKPKQMKLKPDLWTFYAIRPANGLKPITYYSCLSSHGARNNKDGDHRH